MQGQPPPPGGFGQPGSGPPMQMQLLPGSGRPPPGTKSKLLTVFLCVGPGMLGLFGIHRFYTGHIVIGIVQLVTLGGCGIWQLVDLISMLTGKYTDSSGQPLATDPARQLMK